MKNILRNRMALSTVVTTLIILVVSVLLAGVVSYFAINVTSTRVQEESLVLSYQHIWVDSTGTALGAIMVTNAGGRDVVINKLAVRGQAADMDTQVFADPAQNPTVDMEYADPLGVTYVAPDGLIVVPSGTTVGIYITDPDSIGINDIGLTAAFTVFTSQAMYYKETNVQAYIAPVVP